MRTTPESADTFGPLGAPVAREAPKPPPTRPDQVKPGIVRDSQGRLGTNIPVPPIVIEPVHDYEGDYSGMFMRGPVFDFDGSAEQTNWTVAGIISGMLDTIASMHERQAADMAAIKAMESAKADGTLPGLLSDALKRHGDDYAERRKHIQGHYEWQAEMQRKK